jgi:hypothetical protein
MDSENQGHLAKYTSFSVLSLKVYLREVNLKFQPYVAIAIVYRQVRKLNFGIRNINFAGGSISIYFLVTSKIGFLKHKVNNST